MTKPLELDTILSEFDDNAQAWVLFKVFAVADDPKDNPVLACALEGHADFVVTDDRKHLLPLKHYHAIQIVSAPLFLRALRG